MKVSKYKYHFYDIYIFERHRKGYLALSDYSFDDALRPTYFQNLPFENEYVVALPTTDGFSVASITFEELLQLANLSSKSSFLAQLAANVDKNTARSIAALIAAKRILDYRYGAVSLKPDPQNGKATYIFTRYKKINGHNQRYIVLEKDFRRIEQ